MCRNRMRSRSTCSGAVVLWLGIALAMIGSVQAAPVAAAPSAAAAAGARTALPVAESARASSTAVRAAASLASRQQAAARRLQAAARDFHRTVDAVVRVPNDADWVLDVQVLSHRAEFVLAIRNARAVGLGSLARRYQRVLDSELKRLNESRAFSAFLRRANTYGEHVAQKAHDANPNLPPGVLGSIAANAANWYGNDALLKVTLRAAKQKRPGLYEITLKNGGDLDRRAYALYRSLSVGARKTTRPYTGKEGLHELPDADGGFNGGFIGFRRAAETGSDSPAIDINLNGRVIKIHVRHQP
jgi:hypothetical protein